MAAQNYTIQLINGTQTTVQSVLSETFEDKEVFDLTNYRNELDAGYLGRQWSDSGSFAASDFAEESDDRYNAVVPFNEMKKRTRYVLWSGAVGTGDILFWAWFDQIRDVSTSTHSYI